MEQIPASYLASAATDPRCISIDQQRYRYLRRLCHPRLGYFCFLDSAGPTERLDDRNIGEAFAWGICQQRWKFVAVQLDRIRTDRFREILKFLHRRVHDNDHHPQAERTSLSSKLAGCLCVDAARAGRHQVDTYRICSSCIGCIDIFLPRDAAYFNFEQCGRSFHFDWEILSGS